MTERKTSLLEELINEKFKHVNKNMETNNENIISRLDSIDHKFGVLNGRTLKTEENVQDLKLQNVNHLLTCPQIIRIEKMEEEIEERMKAIEKTTNYVELLKSNPKMTVMVIAIAVFLFLNSIGFIKTISIGAKNDAAIEQVVKEQVRVKQELKDTEVEEGIKQLNDIDR